MLGILLFFISLFFVLSGVIPLPHKDEGDIEKIVSYIQDDRTGLCYAVLNNNLTCVPCSYEVSYEAYFNYRGRYISKHYFQKTDIPAGPTIHDFSHHSW
jgi:hypothetical protein